MSRDKHISIEQARELYRHKIWNDWMDTLPKSPIIPDLDDLLTFLEYMDMHGWRCTAVFFHNLTDINLIITYEGRGDIPLEAVYQCVLAVLKGLNNELG